MPKKCLYAHSFHSTDEYFACKDVMYYILTAMCKYLHCNNFMFCMLLCVLEMFHILLSSDSFRDLRNVCMYVCVCVCMYVCVCVYVCMYVCVCVCM